MAKNLCAKTVDPEFAYAVYQSPDKQWTYWVLKKHQADDNKAFGRWFVLVKSPMTSERGELGDAYVETVKDGNRLIDNPLCSHLCVVGKCLEELAVIGLGKYRVTRLEDINAKLWDYLKLAIPKADVENVKRILAEHEVRIVCIDAENAVATCLRDVLTFG